MIVHDSWWSNGRARSTIIDYHEPFDQGLTLLMLKANIVIVMLKASIVIVMFNANIVIVIFKANIVIVLPVNFENVQ